MKRTEILMFGALGGICPSLAGLASSFTADPRQALPVIGVYVGLLLFGLLGAIVAMGFGSKEVKAAIVAGIAAPAIVTNVISGVQGSAPNTNPADGPIAVVRFLATEAHAQTTGQVSSEGGLTRSITINPSVVSGSTNVRDLLEYYYLQGDSTEHTGPVDGTISLQGTQTIVIPENASSLVIGGRTITIDEIISAGDSLNLQIETQPTIGGDLIWALGGSRKYSVSDVQVIP